ncbi:MAG: hypothetical protein FJ284_01335 [Planctomycetes bacterium]|nr:hypothetical protein [Planctomycetota bacterium]
MPDTTAHSRHHRNPFATRHTRPGAVPPLDDEGRPRDLVAVVASLAGLPQAAIVGPHGTGKSTLLKAIEVALSAGGRSAGHLRLQRRRDAVSLHAAILRARRGATLCVDGWERLGWPEAATARLLARLRGCQLVVTAHRAVGMPTAVRTGGSLPLLEAIVDRLPDHGGLIERADLADAFARHAGNLRDSLGDLYDRFERRVRRL